MMKNFFYCWLYDRFFPCSLSVALRFYLSRSDRIRLRLGVAGCLEVWEKVK